MEGWRFYAQRLLTNTWLDRDLPLRDVEITWTLSGPGTLNAIADAVLACQLGPDGYLLLDEWSTAIYAELDGKIRWGGIVESSTELENGERQLECVSFSAYAKGRVYEGLTVNPPGHKKYYETDPFDIIRMLWTEAQFPPRCNIGVQVSTNKAGITIGDPDPGPKPVRSDYPSDAAYQAALTAWQTAPNQPYELAWWNTPDIGNEIDNVIQDVGADYEEYHSWGDSNKDNVIHTIQLYYPSKGRRRFDLRFVEGENIEKLPAHVRDGQDYANYIFAMGIGEDRSTLRANSTTPDIPRVRRDKVYSDKSIASQNRLQVVANNQQAISRDMLRLDNIDVIDHESAPIGSWDLGDEILVQTYTGFEQLYRWFRITGWSINVDDSARAALNLTPIFSLTPVPAPVFDPSVPGETVPPSVPTDPGDAPVVGGDDPVTTPEDPPEPDPSPDPDAPTNTLRIATYNIGDGDGSKKLADLENIIKDADLIGLQEAGDRGKVINQFLTRNKGWAAHTGDIIAKQKVTILYRKSLGTVKVRANRKAVDARYVGPKGAGPATVGPKYILRIDITMADTNRRIVLLNTHLIASATRSKDYLGATEWKRRRDYYHDHIAKLVQYIDDCNGLLFVTGDFNAEPDFELLDPFWPKVNMDHSFNTHGARRIDFVTHRPHNAISIVSRKELSTSSDHDVPIVTYKIKSA